MDDRANALLKALIERYIADGQPVGSRTLSKMFDLSPATIRNFMAELEDLGLIHSLNTSTRRLPTQRGNGMSADPFRSALSLHALPLNPTPHIRPTAAPTRTADRV